MAVTHSVRCLGKDRRTSSTILSSRWRAGPITASGNGLRPGGVGIAASASSKETRGGGWKTLRRQDPEEKTEKTRKRERWTDRRWTTYVDERSSLGHESQEMVDRTGRGARVL